MRKLAKIFKQKGFNFKQLKREGSKAIYSKIKEDSEFISYELVIISKHNGYELGGQYIEPAETYPSSSQWGSKGWTFNSLKDAETKFTKLKIKDE